MYILISIVLMLGGVLMLAAERFGKRTRDLKQMTWLDSIIVGVWQILAMIPGVSRSSATISGGMLRDFNREDAARFSFLMSIPALLGAGVVALKDLFEVPGLLASLAAPLLVGFLAAAITGYFSIRWLLGYLKTRSLTIFVIYRFVFGGLCLIVGLIRLRRSIVYDHTSHHSRFTLDLVRLSDRARGLAHRVRRNTAGDAHACEIASGRSGRSSRRARSGSRRLYAESRMDHDRHGSQSRPPTWSRRCAAGQLDAAIVHTCPRSER